MQNIEVKRFIDICFFYREFSKFKFLRMADEIPLFFFTFSVFFDQILVMLLVLLLEIEEAFRLVLCSLLVKMWISVF